MTESSSGRILGIDAGERRIGIAISDPDRSFALPLNSIEADGRELERLQSLAGAEEVTEVVVGLPLSLNGEDSAQTQHTRDFAAAVEQRLGLPVRFWDERLSSQQAERLTSRPFAGERGGRKGRPARNRSRASAADTDAIAASVILQAYLDRLRFERA